MKTLATRRAALGLLALLAALPLPAAGAAPPTPATAPAKAATPFREEDRWYLVTLQGRRAGAMHETVKRTPEGILTRNEMVVDVKRMDAPATLRFVTEFLETDDGRPLRMSSDMAMGAAPIVMTYTFRPTGVEITGADPTAKPRLAELPKGEWLTPAAAARSVEAQIARGDTEVTVRTVEPSTGLAPATTRMTLAERTTLEVVGRTVPALKWTSVSDAVPNATSTEYTDDRGRTLRTETDLGGLKLVLLLADAQVAALKTDPPELLASTLIVPDRPIERARELKLAQFRLGGPKPALDSIPSGGPQTVDRGPGTGVRPAVVRVDLARSTPAPAADASDPAYTAPSAMIESDDPRVRALLAEALGPAAPAAKPARAEALRRFVHAYISKKTLDVGFATAAETARTRQGDCTEHAVLLTALLRADGIPARVVSGLVYVDGLKNGRGAFGYHMWTQALLDSGDAPPGPRWTDLDATLSPTRAFDATHIALRTDALADGKNALIEMAPTLGALRIVVEKAE